MAYNRNIDADRDVDERDLDLPNDVITFLHYFKEMIENQNASEIQALYEQGFPELTERYFSEKMWPTGRVVEKIVGSDNNLFIILYNELYYRELYTRMQRGPSVGHRYDSYLNYQNLFSEILRTKRDSDDGPVPDEPVKLRLPNVWLWDIIDEFVYQFQAFCLYKANPSKRSPEENDDLQELEHNQDAWNIYPVLNMLYSLIAKSQINEQLKAIREGGNPDEVADEFGQSDLYFGLGYFSLIGLLRTHVLLGDYHQALQTVAYLDMMDPKVLHNQVPSCLVTLHYFVGFSHMMMRNYAEATKIFINCLLYVLRTQNVQQQQQPQQRNKSGKYDVIGKTSEQAFHLLTICLTLQPQRTDESIQTQLQDKFGERMLRMANGDIDEFRSAFQLGCPKFLSPTTVVYEGSNVSKEPLIRQCNAFLEGIETQISLPILRGYLKLYTTLPVQKLASFMDVSDSELDSFLGKLLTYKMIVTELGKETIDKVETIEDFTDLDFYVDKNMIMIADTKVARRVGEYFIKQIVNLRKISQKVKSIGPPQAVKSS